MQMSPKETVKDVYILVRECLNDESTEFLLFTTPPR